MVPPNPLLCLGENKIIKIKHGNVLFLTIKINHPYKYKNKGGGLGEPSVLPIG